MKSIKFFLAGYLCLYTPIAMSSDDFRPTPGSSASTEDIPVITDQQDIDKQIAKEQDLPAGPVTEDSTQEPALESTDAEPPAMVEETVIEPPVAEQTFGDSLEIQEMQEGEFIPVQVLDFPRRGMPMDKVRNELGNPLTMSNTVGNPPITSWMYNDRTVYFESENVVHVVINN